MIKIRNTFYLVLLIAFAGSITYGATGPVFFRDLQVAGTFNAGSAKDLKLKQNVSNYYWGPSLQLYADQDVMTDDYFSIRTSDHTQSGFSGVDFRIRTGDDTIGGVSASTGSMFIGSGWKNAGTSGGGTGVVEIQSGYIENPAAGDSGPVKFMSGYADVANSGYVWVKSGNAGANSGDIEIETGAAGGTRGKIKFLEGSEGTAGKSWVSLSTDGSGHWATAGPTGGGTGIATYTLGDTLYSSASDVLSKLSGNITTTKKYLSQTGNGAVSAAPSWAQPACGDLSNATSSCSTANATANTISTLVARDGSGNFSAGTITASLTGNVTGNVTGAVTGNASTATALAADPADCGANVYATAINASGTLTCASITNASTTATSSAGNSTIVARDGSGNFAAGTITAALTGTASGNTTYSANQYGVVLSGAANTMSVLAPDASTSKILMSGGASANPSWGALTAGANITLTPSAGAIAIAASSSATPAYTMTSQSSTLNPAAVGVHYYLSGANFTVTLPDATTAGNIGKPLVLEHAGTSLTQVYTLNTTSSQTVGGIASGSYVLYTNGEALTLVSDGSNWRIRDHKTETDFSSSSNITITCTTGVKGTTSTDSIRWRRRGRSMIVSLQYTQTGAGTACVDTSGIRITVPGAQSIDTTYTGTNTSTTGNTQLTTGVVFSSFGAEQGGASEMTGVATVYDATHFRIGFQLSGSFTGDWGMSGIYAFNNTTLQVGGQAEFTILGWQP